MTVSCTVCVSVAWDSTPSFLCIFVMDAWVGEPKHSWSLWRSRSERVKLTTEGRDVSACVTDRHVCREIAMCLVLETHERFMVAKTKTLVSHISLSDRVNSMRSIESSASYRRIERTEGRQVSYHVAQCIGCVPITTHHGINGQTARTRQPCLFLDGACVRMKFIH
jgi:hypothetical protein